LGGTVVFGNVLNELYPIKNWLAWSLLSLVGWALLFSAACVSFGQMLLVRVFKLGQLPRLESAVLSMAVGTLAFVLAMCVGGAFGWFNSSFAVLLPITFLVTGATQGYRLLMRFREERCESRRTALSVAVVVFGTFCIGLIYLGVMTPDSINYDSGWYHLRISQDYARWGRIGPFYDYNSSVPHLASIIHTWGYLVPGLVQAERWMLALHMEFFLFLWTLAGVAACVQRLVGDRTLRGTWAAYFLFPAIFVYDNNLGGAADHVLAFFSVPVVLATLRISSGFNFGRCALLASTLAAACLTKYQAIYLVVPVALILTVQWAWAWVRLSCGSDLVHTREYRRNLWWAPVIVIGVGVLLVAPHFLKNYLFYKNPVYPFMQDVFTSSTPTVPNAGMYVDNVFTDPVFIPVGTQFIKLKHAVKLFFTFSFTPHYSFSKNVPSFGSLFTLLLPGLLFVRGKKQVTITAVIGVGALLIWGMTYNVDRNLQTFTPVLVCVTGALVVKLWQLGWLARVGLVPLVLLQVVWGADAPFYSGYDRMNSAFTLIRSGFDGRAETRFDGYRNSYVAIGKAVPKDGKILLHASHMSLGIDRDVLQDIAGAQALINYQRSRTPRELFDQYRSFGITHLLEEQGLTESSKQEEILYHLLASRYGVPMGNFGAARLIALPATPPPVQAPYQVLCLGLQGYEDGLYPIETLTTTEFFAPNLQKYSSPKRPLSAASAIDLFQDADVVLARGGRESTELGLALSACDRLQVRGDVTFYVRRR
jgi:hypothetical protein